MTLEQAMRNPEFDQEEYDFLVKYDTVETYGEVTQATERRINKLVAVGSKYAGIIKHLWDRIRNKNYFYERMFQGRKTSVKQLKEMGLHFDNNIQLNISKRQFRGDATALSINFQKYFSYWQSLDLSVANVYDFNALIKAIYDLEMEKEMKFHKTETQQKKTIKAEIIRELTDKEMAGFSNEEEWIDNEYSKQLEKECSGIFQRVTRA